MRTRAIRAAAGILAAVALAWLAGCEALPSEDAGESIPEWTDLHLPAFPLVAGVAMAVDSGGVPAVALTHFQPLVGDRVRVVRLTNGVDWEELGDFPAASGLRRPAVAIATSGEVGPSAVAVGTDVLPYVAFVDHAERLVSVYKHR